MQMPLELVWIVDIVFSYSKNKESSDYTIILHQLPYIENHFYLQERGSCFKVLDWNFLGFSWLLGTNMGTNKKRR